MLSSKCAQFFCLEPLLLTLSARYKTFFTLHHITVTTFHLVIYLLEPGTAFSPLFVLISTLWRVQDSFIIAYAVVRFDGDSSSQWIA